MENKTDKKEENEDLLWKITKCFIYSKYRNIITNPEVKAVQAHWFACYGSNKLTLKVIYENKSDNEILAQDDTVKLIADKCFDPQKMFVKEIEVAQVTNLEVLAAGRQLKELLEG